MLLTLSMRLVPLGVIAFVVSSGFAAPEDEVVGLAALNKPLKQVAMKDRSAPKLFAAFLKLSPPPLELGDDFNQTTIWPKMERWSDVSKWAQANAAMGEALIESDDATVLGLPYGTDNVDPAWIKAELSISFSGEGTDGRLMCGYFKAIRLIGAYATAEMYRLGEAGDFEQAFAVAIAYARVLRQVCEQSMLEEKLFGLEMLSENLSVHRDFMWHNLDRLPVPVMQRVALKEYSFLKPSDSEKLRRLQMPEGDRIVAIEVLKRALESFQGGEVDTERFAAVLAGEETLDGPLQAFGTQEMWRRVALVHGSLKASSDRLEIIYDDWWRRWKLKPTSPIQQMATELSRTNPIKYAVVLSKVRDVARAFEWRNAVIAEVNGTIVAAGLCGYYQDFKKKWPKNPEQAHAVYFQKRFDFDPYSKKVGHLRYRALPTRQAIDTPLGRVWATGCLVWAIGANHEDDDGATHSTDGAVGDLVLWPPVRALARDEGLLK